MQYRNLVKITKLFNENPNQFVALDKEKNTNATVLQCNSTSKKQNQCKTNKQTKEKQNKQLNYIQLKILRLKDQEKNYFLYFQSLENLRKIW